MNESFNNNQKRGSNGPAPPNIQVLSMNQKQVLEDPASKKKSRSIGHYIIGKNIGEGTFGKVKLGTHILTGEKVG